MLPCQCLPVGPPQPSGGSARWLGGVASFGEPSPLWSVDLGAPTQAPPSPLPERAPSTRLSCDRRLLTVAALYIFSSDYKIPMCPQWEIWKTHKMTERRTAAPVTAPAKSDLSRAPPHPKLLLFLLLSRFPRLCLLGCRLSLATLQLDFSLLGSLSCSLVVSFIVVLATSFTEQMRLSMVSVAVSINSFFPYLSAEGSSPVLALARGRRSLASTRLRARLWVQGQGRRAGPSPWRMAGWPSGHSPGEFPDLRVSWTVSSKRDLQTYCDGAVCEAGLGSELSCQDSTKGGRGSWIPPYSPGKLFLRPPFLVGSSLCLVSSNTQPGSFSPPSKLYSCLSLGVGGAVS